MRPVSEYKPQGGERVRVVLEGDVADDVNSIGFSLEQETGGFFPIMWDDSSVVSIEKIEPPVEVFKPGDRVRSKASGAEFTLGEDGYLAHRNPAREPHYSRWMDYRVTATQPSHFTSQKYERVELG